MFNYGILHELGFLSFLVTLQNLKSMLVEEGPLLLALSVILLLMDILNFFIFRFFLNDKIILLENIQSRADIWKCC